MASLTPGPAAADREPGEIVAEERQRGRPAGLAAIASGIALMAGTVLLLNAINGRPQVTLVEALEATFAGRTDGASLAVPAIEFLDAQATQILVAISVRALSFALIAVALVHLWKAVKARDPRFSPMSLGLVLVGGIGGALFTIASQVALNVAIADFLSGEDRSRAAVTEINSGAVLALQAASSILPLLFALGLVLIALNAMRAGLLTRFLGVLGCFVALLYIIPLGSPLPLVQTFWLIALGVLFLGYWPRGLPPAWAAGRAVPWPTQLELRQQREAARAGAAAPAPPAGPPAPGPSGDRHGKRKRKR